MSKYFEAVQKIESNSTKPVKAPEATERLHERAVVETVDSPVESQKPPAGLTPLTGVEEVRVQIPGGSPVLPFDGSDEIAAERYRIIRTRLLQDVRNPRVVCVSSSGVGDGKTVTAINIAGSLALKRESRVLLVDSDLRRSTVAHMLGLRQSPGLSEVLAGAVSWRDAVIRIADAPNFYVLPSGQSLANPVELLDSAAWRQVCESFRQEFGFVVVDSPPIGIVADFDLIQQPCDGVILVGRQDHSNRFRLLKAIEGIAKDKLIGVVMNCVSPWSLWRTPEVYGYGERYESAREARGIRKSGAKG